MKKIAIIGAGLFGCEAAIALSKKFQVTLFDSHSDLLMGATTHNHLRYHNGYHYPRSLPTALASIQSRKSFEAYYSSAIRNNFPAYYAIDSNQSKTSPESFESFCKEADLKWTHALPLKNELRETGILQCYQVNEEVYDPATLKNLVAIRLANTPTTVKLNTMIIGARLEQSGQKTLTTLRNRIEGTESFDIVVNATYSNLNWINSFFKIPSPEALYETVELLEVKILNQRPVALTIIDGAFSSLLPRGFSDTFTLGHVNHSVLSEKTSTLPSQAANLVRASNSATILAAGAHDFPILKNAQIVRSIFIDRIVKANVDATDERPTEVRDHGHGIYSVFAGKVVTSVQASIELNKLICGL